VKTTFDIIETLMPVINVASVTVTIDGGVYRVKKPLNSELMDIVLLSLPIRGGHEDDVDLQDGTVIINIYCKNFETTGQPDTVKLEASAKAVIAVIEAYEMSNDYYEFDIANQTIMNDPVQKNMSFVSIRINYVVQIID